MLVFCKIRVDNERVLGFVFMNLVYFYLYLLKKDLKDGY